MRILIGGVQEGRWTWDGSAWGTNSLPRRITGWVDGTTRTTGVYAYTMEVTNYYGTAPKMTAVSDELIVVNRQTSPFGAGWWLAGWERLYHLSGNRKLVVGADGSGRVYTPVNATTWVAAGLTFPDTLKQVGTEYEYALPGASTVRFTAAGYHKLTRNRLGHETAFTVSGSALTQIRLPTQGGGQTYTFAYANTGGTRLSAITAPPVDGQARVVTVAVTGNQVLQFTDPDQTTEQFVYWNAGRIRTRTGKRGEVTSYSYDSIKKLWRAHLALANGDSVRVRFIDRWQRGIAAIGSHYTPNVNTLYVLPRQMSSGPGALTSQAYNFHLNRLGAPYRVWDPSHLYTWWDRNDAEFPGLITRTKAVNGLVQGAGYDRRGHLVVATDSSTLTTTRYAWDDRWDALTDVVTPEGERTTMFYGPAVGNRWWQEDGRGPMSRASFQYYWGAGAQREGRLKSVTSPLGRVTAVDYDTRGNPTSVTTPLGFVRTMLSDAIGRDTLVVTPIAAGKTQRVRTWYDGMGRVDSTISSGPAMTYVPPEGGLDTIPAESLIVDNTYNANGQVTTVKRRSEPDPRGQGWSVTTYEYDLAGRKTAEVNDGRRTEYTHDANGNVITTVMPRGDTLRMVYDSLDHLRQRIVPLVDYADTACATYCAIGQDIPWQFPEPAFANNGTGIRIAAAVDSFRYDLGGNLTQAYNGDARVDRVYAKNGRLLADTLRIRRYGGTDFTTHVYGLEYTYDLDGRRVTLTHPGPVSPVVNGQAQQVQRYHYDPGSGALDSVISPLGYAYTWAYDRDGRLTTYRYPGGVETHVYDADGRRTGRSDLVGSSTWHSDGFTYDQRGRVLTVGGSPSAGLTWNGNLDYSGLGTLAHSWVHDNAAGRTVDEQFRTDALDRVTWSKTWTDDGWNVNWYEWDQYYAFGAMTLKQKTNWDTQQSPDQWHPTQVDTDRDIGGNVVATGSITEMPVSSSVRYDLREGTHNYYGADNKLRFRQVYRDSVLVSGINYFVKGRSGVFEEYWYDALGRRILLRSRGAGSGPTSTTSVLCWNGVGNEVCYDGVERYLWDGNQLLAETRYADLNDAPPLGGGSGTQYGWVVYTHGGGVDAPLEVLRLGGYSHTAGQPVIPHVDWRGHHDAGSFPDGTQFGCQPVLQSGCRDVGWAGGNLSAYLTPGKREPPDWFGSLIGGNRDQSGLRYMRNRYYDPATGQFTQEDPIGIAGGLNLYGFAGGDPVNFSDPFGLCPDGSGDDGEQTTNVGDCKGKLAGAWHALGASEAGRAVISGIVSGGIEVSVGGCAKSDVSCFNPNTMTITLESDNNTGENAVALGHEFAHAVEPPLHGTAPLPRAEQRADNELHAWDASRRVLVSLSWPNYNLAFYGSKSLGNGFNRTIGPVRDIVRQKLIQCYLNPDLCP